jgi:hypothetical protein
MRTRLLALAAAVPLLAGHRPRRPALAPPPRRQSAAGYPSMAAAFGL